MVFCVGWVWFGSWPPIRSNSSFLRSPACCCLRSSLRRRTSSRMRFCSSIFSLYCRVSSSSSGFCGVVLDCAAGCAFFISGALGCSGALAEPCPCGTGPTFPAGPERATGPCLTFCVALVTGFACPLGTDGQVLLLLVAMGSSRRLLLR